MTWEPELEELARREALAEQLGGVDKVERQHHFGKLTVRERIEQIADDGSFWELGKTAGVARRTTMPATSSSSRRPTSCSGSPSSTDRPVVLSGDDFTVRGGSNDASISAKREASESLAAEMRLPHVRLLDGMSGGGSVKTIEQAGRTYIPVLPGWHVVVDHLNIAPSVSLVLGSVAGFGAARAVASHYSVMVRDTSQMMIAGPALVEQAGLGSVVEGGAGSRRHPQPRTGRSTTLSTARPRRSSGRSTSCRTSRRTSTSSRRWRTGATIRADATTGSPTSCRGTRASRTTCDP